MIYNLQSAPRPSSWSVANISGVSYKFALNSKGYYESNNKGVANSAAMCRVNLKITKPCNVVFKCINYAEANYDFGLLGALDTAMNTSYSDTSTGVSKSFKGSSMSSVQTYTYGNVSAGDHFIDVKYRKDSSADSNNDSFQFTVEFSKVQSGTTCCFIGDTLVLMGDKSVKKIEDVKVGDTVLSYNEKTKEMDPGVVTRFIKKENTTDMAKMEMETGEAVVFNAYHPFFTADGWKSLTQHEGLPLLTENDSILSPDGTYTKVRCITRWISEQPVVTYTLDIETNDNFFVGEKDHFLLAHNVAIAC